MGQVADDAEDVEGDGHYRCYTAVEVGIRCLIMRLHRREEDEDARMLRPTSPAPVPTPRVEMTRAQGSPE